MNSYCKNRWGEEWNNDQPNPDLLDNKTFKDTDDSVQTDQKLKIDNTLTLDQQMQHHLQEELSLQHLHIFNQLQVTNIRSLLSLVHDLTLDSKNEIFFIAFSNMINLFTA